MKQRCSSAADVLFMAVPWVRRKAYVNNDELMDFLQDTVAKAPDLPPEGEPEQPKAKRQRWVSLAASHDAWGHCWHSGQGVGVKFGTSAHVGWWG